MHSLLEHQLREAARKDSGEIDLDALLAMVDRTYRERAIASHLDEGGASARDSGLPEADTGKNHEHDTVLAAILDNASDGMLVVCMDGTIDIANAAAERQFSAAANDLCGRNIGALLGSGALAIASGEQPASEPAEASGTALDGRSFPIEYSCAALSISGRQRQLWIVRDISERVRTRSELLESRMRFRDFAEASSDCFWEMDRNLQNCEVTAADESDLAAHLKSLLSAGAAGSEPPMLAEEGSRALRHFLATRQRFRVRLDLRKEDGEALHVSVSGKPVFDLDGRFRGYRGTGRDVTREVSAREAARRAERRLIEAMEAAPFACALVDAGLNLVSGNSALRAIAALRGERLAFGRRFDAFLSPQTDERAAPAELLRHLAATREMREVTIAGAWYLLAVRSLSDGGMVLTFSDITRLKERESELAEATRAAESASRLKSQFLATMSHELRTPLNAILGFSEVIRDTVLGYDQSALNKYTEYAGSIHASGRHLLSLISEILDLSKIEAGSYVLDVVRLDLRDVLGAALTIIAPAAAQSAIDLKYAPPAEPVWISGDDRAMRQIALNLLSNAVKFTPTGGAVAIDIARQDRFAELVISDTGIGIAEDHLADVFELFRQVDASISRRHEGTGLGLAITKRLVELHGGEIALHSELAVGTTVRVRIPFASAGMAAGEAAA